MCIYGSHAVALRRFVRCNFILLYNSQIIDSILLRGGGYVISLGGGIPCLTPKKALGYQKIYVESESGG